MIITKETNIRKDASGKKLIVTRDFDAPVEKVWRAWTESSLLDNWWAPRPWRAQTKSLAFKEGGRWLYAMVGPDGTRMCCRVDFQTIQLQKNFTALSSFCDENGMDTGTAPAMEWKVEFKSAGTATMITVEISFDSEADLQKIVEMGFKEGFTMALGNLDEILDTELH